MAIEIPKTKNRNNGPILIIFILFVVVAFFVFISLRKNLGAEINDTSSETISSDTKKLIDIEKNLDKNINVIFQNSEFMSLSKHNDINDQFEVGKTDPFNSF